jgi:hypothetical protein
MTRSGSTTSTPDIRAQLTVRQQDVGVRPLFDGEIEPAQVLRQE